VVQKIDADLENAGGGWNHSRRKAAWVELQRDFPELIEEGGQLKLDLAHDLRPAVEGLVRGLPLGEG
jgi:hypothetical protein